MGETPRTPPRTPPPGDRAGTHAESEWRDREFSVVQWFEGGSYEYVRQWCTLAEAMKAFRHYSTSVAACMGVTTRVIVTADGGDEILAEWKYGEGVVFPR